MCETVVNLDDCMEKADSKDDLPPLASQNVVFKKLLEISVKAPFAERRKAPIGSEPVLRGEDQ